MQLIWTTVIALTAMIVLWALGVSGFDALIVALAVVICVATWRIAVHFVVERRNRE